MRKACKVTCGLHEFMQKCCTFVKAVLREMRILVHKCYNSCDQKDVLGPPLVPNSHALLLDLRGEWAGVTEDPSKCSGILGSDNSCRGDG